jgi:hypothetical protein
MAEKQAPNKLLLAVGAIALLAAGGWYAWQQFMTEPPPPPPKATARPAARPAAKPAVAPAPDQDKIVGELMVVTGLDHAVVRLPETMLEGMRQAARQDKSGNLKPADLAEMERLMRQSYTTDGFRRGVTAGLKRNFHAGHYQAVLADSSTPLARRLTELEKQEPGQAELAAFMKTLEAKPLSPARAQTLARLDAASRGSEVALESMLSGMKGMAIGFSSADPKQQADAERVIEQQRTAMADTVRNGILLFFAFIYRDVGDADLAEYARMLEKDSSRYFQQHASAALIEEIRAGGQRFGAGLGKMAKARFAKDLAAGVKGQMSPPVPAGKAPAPPVMASAEPRRESRRGGDARECLRFADNLKVMGCAERYR